MPYYSLYIPSCSTNVEQTQGGNSAQSSFVFTKKGMALDLLKLHKDARLREFNNEEDALNYSQTGYEVITTRYADSKSTAAAAEKAIFRAPTKQELIEFRKIIEAGDHERVKSIVWDNPRYLVSSGDTPTTLKEGYRYNAMHVCAISKRPRVAELILQTVSDVKFVDLLTGKKNEEKMCKELCANLLDYYLNIPEKGRSETPLHFASKIACVEMVEVLTSYRECKMTPNSEGKLPKDIIGSRNAQATPEACKKIEALLEERFYVPVLRSVDGSVPPQIGQVFSANNPPNFNCDPLSPEVKIQAMAGPMNMEQAKQFRRRWKTPPRIGSNAASPIANNPFISPMKPRNAGNTCTPIKTTPNNNNSQSTLTANRVLFQSTPMRASSNEKILSENQIPIIELNGEKTSQGATQAENKNENILEGIEQLACIDKQNGNHKSNEANDDMLYYEELTETTTVLDVKMEANNNEEQPTIEVKTRELVVTESALCPSTPLLKSKKNAFFTYREQYAPSPLDFGMLNTDGCIATTQLDNIGETPVNKIGRRPKPSNRLNTPLLKLKKDALAVPQKEHLAVSTDEMQATCNGDNSLLAERSSCETPGYMERHIKISDTQKGLEIIGRELAKEQHVEWQEYWDFLGALIDIASVDGLQQLENYFALRVREEELAKKATQATANSDVMLADVCSVLEKFVFPGGDVGQLGGRNGFNSDRNRYSGSMTTSEGSASGASTATTPYTCVEKSLQVFAKRMTKTIIHNINNVVSINDTLMSELKRLKSLICSFKEDTRFLDVNFAKVHSRIGNLVSIYLENSQEISIKSKIQTIIQNLLTATSERREHIECVCSRIHYTLTHPTEQIQPENLKTEAMCAKVWQNEKDCDCQWETNLSRKVSRRNRMESRYKSLQHVRRQEINNINRTENNDEWRAPTNDLEDDVFWSDFGGSDTEEEEEDVWVTPPESPSGCILLESGIEDDGYKTYIFGNEPTKRDLDVLNAIFHVEIDKQKFPYVYAWRDNLLHIPNEEMDFFPSPSVIKKSQSFIKSNRTTKLDIPQTPPLHKRALTQTTPAAMLQQSPIRKADNTISTAKRLFISPAAAATRQKPTATNSNKDTAAPTTTSTTQQPTPYPNVPQRNQAFMTPLNRLRGLFYRDRSPLSSASSASPAAYIGDRSGSDGSNNLSFLNVSAAE